MIFETKSGSIYEIDEENKRIRRVHGEKPGTQRIGNDGAWRTYAEISSPALGKSVYVFWNNDDVMCTSRVVAIGELN